MWNQFCAQLPIERVSFSPSLSIPSSRSQNVKKIFNYHFHWMGLKLCSCLNFHSRINSQVVKQLFSLGFILRRDVCLGNNLFLFFFCFIRNDEVTCNLSRSLGYFNLREKDFAGNSISVFGLIDRAWRCNLHCWNSFPFVIAKPCRMRKLKLLESWNLVFW